MRKIIQHSPDAWLSNSLEKTGTKKLSIGQIRFSIWSPLDLPQKMFYSLCFKSPPSHLPVSRRHARNMVSLRMLRVKSRKSAAVKLVDKQSTQSVAHMANHGYGYHCKNNKYTGLGVLIEERTSKTSIYDNTKRQYFKKSTLKLFRWWLFIARFLLPSKLRANNKIIASILYNHRL